MASRGKDVHGIDGLCRGDPGSSGIMETERAVKNNASDILTLKQCSALRQCEKHGLADIQDRICEDIDAGGGRDRSSAVQCEAPSRAVVPSSTDPRVLVRIPPSAGCRARENLLACAACS